MGLVDGIKDPKKVEMELWKIIPPEKAVILSRLVIMDGRSVRQERNHIVTDAVLPIYARKSECNAVEYKVDS